MTWVDWIIPGLLVVLLSVAALRRLPVYEIFLRGAEKGLRLLWTVLPSLLSVMIMVQLLETSGIMGGLSSLLAPILEKVGFAPEAVPLAIIRPFSGAAAMGVLRDIIAQYGVDSRPALTAAVILGSSETLFYTIALYCGAARVRKTRMLIPLALLSQLLSMILAGWLVSRLCL